MLVGYLVLPISPTEAKAFGLRRQPWSGVPTVLSGSLAYGTLQLSSESLDWRPGRLARFARFDSVHVNWGDVTEIRIRPDPRRRDRAWVRFSAGTDARLHFTVQPRTVLDAAVEHLPVAIDAQ